MSHININTYLARLGISEAAFNPENATVSWNGKRIVKIDGKEMNLKDLAHQIIQISSSTAVDELSARERLAALKVVKKIRKAFEVTDQKVQDANIFTRALVWMRESTCCFTLPEMYGTRWLIDEKTEQNFISYSPEAFQKEFGELPVEGKNCWPLGYRVTASKKDIAAVVQKSLTVTSDMVQEIHPGEWCDDVWPCSHDDTKIVLKDGREFKAWFEGPEIYILLRDTGLNLSENSWTRRHFDRYGKEFSNPHSLINHNEREYFATLNASDILSSAYERSLDKQAFQTA